MGEEEKGKKKTRVSQEYKAEVAITVSEETFIINEQTKEVGTYNFAQHGYQPWSVDHIKVFLNFL